MLSNKEALEKAIEDISLEWEYEGIEDELREKLKPLYEDLDRLEKLEKTIELLKTRIKIETYHEPKSRYYYLYIGGRIVLLSREEYELLKEVLE